MHEVSAKVCMKRKVARRRHKRESAMFDRMDKAVRIVKESLLMHEENGISPIYRESKVVKKK